MNKVSKDVARYLLEYIYFSRSIKHLIFINKWWNKTITESKFINNYKKVEENMQMHLEDFKREENKFLLDNWELYNGWKIIKNKYITIKKNAYVDVKDRVNVWSSAKIIDIEIVQRENTYTKEMEVVFFGWSNRFNEKVDISKIKPFGTKTLNYMNKYENLKELKDWTWVLFKEDKNINYESYWDMVKIKVIEINKNNIIIQKQNNEYCKVTKNNINKKIKCCTDGNSFLCRRGQFYPYYRRITF